MNEHDESVPPIILPATDPAAPGEPPPPKRSRPWLQRLFACNPFYLLSAALLLFGCYRISADGKFFTTEAAQLLFNFSSLQLYEILLVLTAIFLARRSLWYDSTLLVILENLLVFVPFILISQAALIDAQEAQGLCLAGALVAMLRFGGLKRGFAQLNLPGRVLGVGLVLLTLNVILPLIFRHFGETKVGVHIDSGPAYEMNEYTWLLILPAAFGLANLLPHAREPGGLLPQRRWLPAGLFTLWIAVTSVHLYCLDYIYQFDLRRELVAPTLWVLAWTGYRAAPAMRGSNLRNALAFLPILIPFLLASPNGTKAFLVLNTLNLGIFGGLWFLERDNRLVRHLLFASALLVFAGLPENWMHFLTPHLSRSEYAASGVVACLILWTVLVPNPKLAILGALALGCAVAAVFHHQAGAVHWGLQSGLAFLLLQSLRWNDLEHQGAGAVRWLAGLLWVAHSLVWMHAGEGSPWMPCIPGGIVLGIYLATQLFRGCWGQFAVPVAATLVILSGPGTATANGLNSLPLGLLAVIGSFLLFGCGTVAALTRQHWHRNGGG